MTKEQEFWDWFIAHEAELFHRNFKRTLLLLRTEN